MSVLYRAVWQCEVASSIEQTLDEFRASFSRWALDSADADPLSDGTMVRGDRTITLSARDGDVPGLDAECRDERSATRALWRTVVRVAVEESGAHYLVENHLESDDVTARVAVGRPRIVRELLGGEQKRWWGNSALLTAPLDVSAPEVPVLAEMLRDPNRTLPYVVFSEPPQFLTFDWRELARKTAERATGVATVITLDRDAVTAFKEEFGDLAVWGGGVRTYVPTPVAGSGTLQHRYIPARHVASADPNRIVDRLVLSVAQMSARRRVPEIFASALPADGADVSAVSEQLVARGEAIDSLEYELALARDDHNETERELARARGHLSRLEAALRAAGQSDTFYGTAHAIEDDALPDEVQAVSEAFLAAQMYLDEDLVVPDSAARDHLPLDTVDCSVAWGNTTWRGLRSLAAYVRDKRAGFVGDFWIWCQAGRPEGWPATKKKLAMVEADSVRTRTKFRSARLFTVDVALDPAGEKFMESHLKIAEGGGDLAPRVYFYDDTGGATGKVHVGFVGPHYLVPNTKT